VPRGGNPKGGIAHDCVECRAFGAAGMPRPGVPVSVHLLRGPDSVGGIAQEALATNQALEDAVAFLGPQVAFEANPLGNHAYQCLGHVGVQSVKDECPWGFWGGVHRDQQQPLKISSRWWRCQALHIPRKGR